MPYPHHPQHQHHQKIHCPSQQPCRVAMNRDGLDGCCDHDDDTAGTNDVMETTSSPNSQDSRHAQSGSPSSSSSNFLGVSSTSLASSFTPPPNPKPSSWPPAQASSYSSSSSSSSSSACPPPKDVEMMPLDLSFRGAQKTEESGSCGVGSTRHAPEHQLSGGPTKHPISGQGQGHCRSQRLSPYPLFSLGMARSPAASSCLPLSRSPHSRSNSPFYHIHRQTPSPYYSCLTPQGAAAASSSSYFGPAENSPFHVFSTTNRVLNGLSTGSPGVFRPYEDHIPQDATPPPLPSRLPTEEVAPPSQEPEESEEPTYYDLDCVVQKQVATTTTTVSDTSFNNSDNNSVRPPTAYRQQFQAATSLNTSQYTESNASPFFAVSAAAQNRSMMTFTPPSSSSPSCSSSSSSSLSSSTSSSSNSPSSSTPPAFLPQISYTCISQQQVSEPAAHCDLAHQSVLAGTGHAFPPYRNNNNNDDEVVQKSNNPAAAISSHAIHALSPQDRPEYRQQHQDPDSSSSLSAVESSASPSRQSPAGSTSFGSSSASPTKARLPNSMDTLTHYPYSECDGSVTSTGTIVSNKENLRDSHFRPQSFFRAPDKDFMEQTCRILAEKHRNEGANRMSLLDFWISKIQIAAAQSRKSNICHNLQSKSKIKIRMVELMELQVEQSLRCEWR